MVLFLGVFNQLHTLNGLMNMENVKIFPYVPKIRKMHSGCCVGTICLHTPTKSSLAVILRGQPSFCDHRFTRYGFCDFLPRTDYFQLTDHDPKYGPCFFLTLLGSYNEFLKRKWSYMEVYTGGNSALRVLVFYLKKYTCNIIFTLQTVKSSC